MNVFGPFWVSYFEARMTNSNLDQILAESSQKWYYESHIIQYFLEKNNDFHDSNKSLDICFALVLITIRSNVDIILTSFELAGVNWMGQTMPVISPPLAVFEAI